MLINLYTVHVCTYRPVEVAANREAQRKATHNEGNYFLLVVAGVAVPHD